MISGFRLRLIDTAGSVIGIVGWASETVSEGDMVRLPDGRPVEVIEVYDDEFGQEGVFRPQSSWMTSRSIRPAAVPTAWLSEAPSVEGAGRKFSGQMATVQP
jgi:hypothetical protein